MKLLKTIQQVRNYRHESESYTGRNMKGKNKNNEMRE